MPAISKQMLVNQLRELEEDAILERIVYAEMPPRVEYKVTEYGLSLMPVINDYVTLNDRKQLSFAIMKKAKFIVALSILVFLSPSVVSAQIEVGVSISANIAPPELPVYTQPPCPADGYMWTPGYWAYDGGYYWVPGVWVRPPQIGFLWTPSYWGFVGGIYGWHNGYWGSQVGFYGGVNYGYGYGGSGFGGGRWEGGSFRYNTAVVNVNRTIVHNTYVDRTVIVNGNNRHTSFNGGPGGIAARPNAREQSAMQEHHVAPTSEQASHQQMAGHDKSQFASVNHGRPVTATMNTVGGHRFNQQGHAPNAVAANHPSNTNHQAPQSRPQQHAPQQQQHVQQHTPQQHAPQQQQHAPQQQQHAPAPAQQHHEESHPEPHHG
ncbi:HxlR-like helix-turn-helix-domain-containing protein [Russula earlei]|uniref:HxlR-like helix-turn-helix-domain-containing protein n=1 Tax=Russula earlei TaxID=71964 RepID=A0ACC0TQS6_9AGAM|nr:HxlR-like helix-turn-helix-domain-containing protein [Russula earlei]